MENFTYRLVIRKDTFNSWAVSTYIPLEGEPCFDTTNKVFKIGNGVDLFPSLNAISENSVLTKLISEDTTIHVSAIGSDITGDGSVMKPFASPHKALEYLSDKLIGDCEVTISIKEGKYDFTESVKVNHPNSNKINIIGAGLNGPKIEEVHYVPIDGPYMGINTKKFLVSSRPVNGTTSDWATDFVINKSLVEVQYKTVLNFTGCSGFDIDGVQLKQIDKMAIIGDNSTSAKSGINIGFTGNSEELRPKGGSVSLGTAKDYNEVLIMGFKSAGVNSESGSGTVVGNVTVLHCNIGARVRASYLDFESPRMINCGTGIMVHDGATISYGNSYNYGCITANTVYGAIMEWLITTKATGCTQLFTLYGTKPTISIDYNNVKDCLKLFGGGYNNEVVIRREGTVNNTSILTYDISVENNRCILKDYTLQNAIDMNWNLPLDIIQPGGSYIATAINTVKDFTSNIVEETNAAAYTPDFGINDYFEYTLEQDSTIENPLNFTKGQRGILVITQDITGNWETTFASNWFFVNGAPILDKTPGRLNFLRYTVVTDDKILVEYIADLQAINQQD